jgi:hypothetical protein
VSLSADERERLATPLRALLIGLDDTFYEPNT